MRTHTHPYALTEGPPVVDRAHLALSATANQRAQRWKRRSSLRDACNASKNGATRLAQEQSSRIVVDMSDTTDALSNEDVCDLLDAIEHTDDASLFVMQGQTPSATSAAKKTAGSSSIPAAIPPRVHPPEHLPARSAPPGEQLQDASTFEAVVQSNTIWETHFNMRQMQSRPLVKLVACVSKDLRCSLGAFPLIDPAAAVRPLKACFHNELLRLGTKVVASATEDRQNTPLSAPPYLDAHFRVCSFQNDVKEVRKLCKRCSLPSEETGGMRHCVGVFLSTGKCIGVISFTLHGIQDSRNTPLVQSEAAVCMHTLAVDGPYRRIGIGTQLLRIACMATEGANAVHLFAQCSTSCEASEFYARHLTAGPHARALVLSMHCAAPKAYPLCIGVECRSARIVLT